MAAILAGTACSGGGVTPERVAAPQPSLPMPAGVSPASVRPAPMAQTAIQPASAMTSRRPATAIVPQAWQQIPGSASDVTAAADGSIWVLSDQPSGADKYIWHYQGTTWTNIGGLAAHIAVAPNGTLYAVNSGGGLYAYNGSWSGLGGGTSTVGVASDNSVYTIVPGSPDGTIWHYVGGVWSQVPGTGVFLAGGLDTSSHTVPGGTLAPGGMYVVNSLSRVYYLNTDKTYALLSGTAVAVSSTPGGTLGLGTAGGSSHPLYYYDLDTPGWSQQTGTGIAISSNAGNLFVINASNAIFRTSLTTVPNPLVASIPTLDLAGIGASYARTYSVSETGYSGAITETDNCSGIATVSPSNGSGPSYNVTATGVAVGSCTATYKDTYNQSATVTISVTTGSVTII